jgi:hypothetical protein
MDILFGHLSMQQIAPRSRSMESKLNGVWFTIVLMKSASLKEEWFGSNGATCLHILFPFIRSKLGVP